MGLFDKWFGQGETDDENTIQVDFGRYTDTYKTTAQLEEWDKSLELFEQEAYTLSYIAFFNYLKDEMKSNVTYEVQEDQSIHFKIYQGSKAITGLINQKKVMAEAKVAKVKQSNVGFLRRLMERNFSLYYSRFAIDENNDISIIFDSYLLDGSPYKLYNAIKEVATNADKQDDLLVEEFEMLSPIFNGKIRELSDTEKETKYQWMIKSIQTVIDQIESKKLNPNEFPGGVAYLLLNLTYKLDYLIKPEGFLMETLERIHRLYFAKDGRTTVQKNHELIKQYKKILEREKADFFKEMYEVTSTFGITTSVGLDRLTNFIDGELNNINWYMENGHEEVAIACAGYISGYSMFNWAVPKPARQLLHLLFEIVEQDFFEALGFNYEYIDKSGRFNKSAIKKKFNTIEEDNEEEYPNLNIRYSKLETESMALFVRSYLLLIKDLELV